METQTLKLGRDEARHLYREYRKHVHYSTPIDQEIMRTYQLIAQGRIVIKALESIVVAGLKEDGLPKLAITRADSPACKLVLRNDGSATMTSEDRVWRRNNASRSKWFDFKAGSFNQVSRRIDRYHYEALTPPVPLHLRPKRGLENYHVLWEAEWERVVPKDPYLLRRIGKGDLWLVVAAWDLTEVERAALATRIQ